ncbi:MAG: hypothetical protein E7523_11385 [Ruminococcaceae bacterium]|nr:hypothetical protein [Oscillospiraceae bacterium]
MQEYLNKKEKEMLVFLGEKYLKYYETQIDLPDHDFDVFERRPIDLVQNILDGLEIRDYISFGRLYVERGEPARFVYLKEKALNLFNSEEFAKMKEEAEK